MALSVEQAAPYAPASAILSLLERNRKSGLPANVDKDALGRLGVSDSLIPRTLQALVALDLIDESGSHTDVLKGLRLAPEADYQSRLRGWLDGAYAEILQYVNPEDGEETDVRDAFRPYKPTSMQDRMVTLFTGLYGAAGVWPESAQRARVNKLTRLKPKPRNLSVPNGDPRGKPEPVAKPAPMIGGGDSSAEKALEYRLVDLMAEAAGKADVMAAIITVITFLKTKDVPPLDGGNNGTGQGG